MELWKPIQGYEGLYEVSNLGRIKSVERYVLHKDGRKPQYHKECMIKQQNSKKGYKIIRLSKNHIAKGFQVHRIVAEAFVPNPDNKPQVNHCDGNRSNNQADNLEWVTNSENLIHAYFHGLAKPHTKTIEQLDLNGNLIKVYASIESVRADGFIPENIVSICKGTYGRYTHKGYKWRYAE